MSLTVIFGEPGVGKSALLTSFLRRIYHEEGFNLLDACCQSIMQVNIEKGRKLSCPDRMPIFTDYKVSFLVGYEETYSTYFTNGFYAGLPHEGDSLYIPSYSVIGLSEVQRYYDSRKKGLPSWVSRTFEMHRHDFLDIYLDLQRFMLLDKNIRENCTRFIQVLRMEHKTNVFGGIIATKWFCREWDNSGDCEHFLNTGDKNYNEVEFSYQGNIFDCYESYNYKDKFLPPSGKDYLYLEHIDDIEDLPEDMQTFYSFSEPMGYR